MSNRWPSWIGRRFGNLVVLGQVQDETSRSRRWRCLCDCGAEDIVASNRLTHRDPVRACKACRTPTCRNCGRKLTGPSRFRTCSTECRRTLTARLQQESRARQALADPEYKASRAAYNARRLATSAEAREARNESVRMHRRRMRDDPEWTEKERARHRAYHDEKRTDPIWMERERIRVARYRAEREATLMQTDITSLTGKEK